LSDVLVWGTCLLLTVFFDMVVAITTGILLASVLFMKEIATLTLVVDVTDDPEFVHQPLPGNWKVFKINGPLFFAAADGVFGVLAKKTGAIDGLILPMRYSAYLDAGGLLAIVKLIAHCERRGLPIRFTAWKFQPLKTLAKARGDAKSPLDVSFPTLD